MIALAALKRDGQTRSKVCCRALALARALRGKLFVVAKQLQQRCGLEALACKPLEFVFSRVQSREIYSRIYLTTLVTKNEA